MKTPPKSYTVAEISKLIDGKLIGQTSHRITEPEQIEAAGLHSITFIGHKKYVPLWEKSKASAAIVNRSLGLTDPGENRSFIEVDNADLAMAKLLDLFTPDPVKLNSGIHPTATVDASAIILEGAVVGAHTYLGARASIGKNTFFFPNVTILYEAVFGDGVKI